MGKHVYVIGAGASHELDLPTGIKLRNKISLLLKPNNLIQGDTNIRNAMITQFEKKQASSTPIIDNQKWDELIKKAVTISNGVLFAPSIDNYIYNRSNDEDIGNICKLAIAEIITKAESQSKLALNQNNSPINTGNLRETWYPRFYELLTEQCLISELMDRFSKVALIIFNYDRCIEHYLNLALQTSYDITESEAGAYLSHLEIYHPYGSIGPLPWQSSEGSHFFGKQVQYEKLPKIAENINTFTEGTNASESEITQIRELFQHPAKLVFLGFAYHQLNLDFLKPTMRSGSRNILPCYGTADGFSESDSLLLKNRIEKAFHVSGVELDRCKCHEFMNKHQVGLSFLDR